MAAAHAHKAPTAKRDLGEWQGWTWRRIRISSPEAILELGRTLEGLCFLALRAAVILYAPVPDHREPHRGTIPLHSHRVDAPA